MKEINSIEAFLNKEMTDLERNDFLNEMKLNKSLASEVTLHQDINEAILDDRAHEFRKSVKDIIFESREHQPRTYFVSRRLVKYPMVASIFILIGFSLWQILMVVHPEKIYSKFYRPYETDLSTRSSTSVEDKSLIAIQLYQKGEYEASFEILNNYISKNFGDQTARFYFAMNSLELGKMDLAVTELKQVEQDPSTNFALHARWYLSLAYLKMNQKNEAMKYLLVLVSYENFYSEKAQEVLNKLKS